MKTKFIYLTGIMAMLMGFVNSGRAQQAPAITNQPVNLTVSAGGTASFSIGVTGTGPFTYQWLQNGNYITNNIITTVAGKGQGYSGDDGPATNASLDYPQSLAVDGSGNLLIADTFNNRIRRVDTNGIITTVAGNGAYGFSGDGLQATNSGLPHPSGVALDTHDRLFIADPWIYRLRLDDYGIMITVAGNGNYGGAGDNGPAYQAGVEPVGDAIDASDNLYIADARSNTIRKVSANGIITTVAGNGDAFDYTYINGGPATNATLDFNIDDDDQSTSVGMGVDDNDDLYFTDNYACLIRKVSPTGIITTVAGIPGSQAYSGDGGPATNASLYNPSGMAIDTYGDLFIADTGNNRIREVSPAGVITTVAGNGKAGYPADGGPATNSSLSYPSGIAIDMDGNLFIATGSSIRKVTIVGPVLTLPAVNTFNAGNYQVIVSSAYGSITSSIATLAVSPPVISATPNGNGSVTLNLQTAASTSSRIQAATNLTPPVVWQSIGTNVPGANGLWQFTDTNASQYPARFYRTSTP